MTDARMSPQDYLKKPYSRILIPDEESGTYTAQIQEFPGCVAQGDTPQEAYDHLELAAESWIEAATSLGQDIPQPMSEHECSGKFPLRLPKSLHRQASLAADRDGTSLNQFIITAIAEKVGASNMYVQIMKRLPVGVAVLPPIVGTLPSEPNVSVDLLAYQAAGQHRASTASFLAAGGRTCGGTRLWSSDISTTRVRTAPSYKEVIVRCQKKQ